MAAALTPQLRLFLYIYRQDLQGKPLRVLGVPDRDVEPYLALIIPIQCRCAILYGSKVF